MQQRVVMSGFSDLKGLLIRTYKIDRDTAFVKLYFTENRGELLMHDYDDHEKVICLSSDIKGKLIRPILAPKALQLVKESFAHSSPAQFLNREFQLNGFFRS